jgi:hypothetical protein
LCQSVLSADFLLESARQLPFFERFPVAISVVNDSRFSHEAGTFFLGHAVDWLEFDELFTSQLAPLWGC